MGGLLAKSWGDITRCQTMNKICIHYERIIYILIRYLRNNEEQYSSNNLRDTSRQQNYTARRQITCPSYYIGHSLHTVEALTRSATYWCLASIILSRPQPVPSERLPARTGLQTQQQKMHTYSALLPKAFHSSCTLAVTSGLSSITSTKSKHHNNSARAAQTNLANNSAVNNVCVY
jgi:hypothetical protein